MLWERQLYLCETKCDHYERITAPGKLWSSIQKLKKTIFSRFSQSTSSTLKSGGDDVSTEENNCAIVTDGLRHLECSVHPLVVFTRLRGIGCVVMYLILAPYRWYFSRIFLGCVVLYLLDGTFRQVICQTRSAKARGGESCLGYLHLCDGKYFIFRQTLPSIWCMSIKFAHLFLSSCDSDAHHKCNLIFANMSKC